MSGILTSLDLTVCVVGILGVMAIGMWTSRKDKDAKDFFLAGRTIPWWAITGSIFATNISSNHIVGFTGIGYSEGFAQANFEFGAVAGLLVLAYFLMPIYRATGVYTLSDFLGRRYDERSRVLYWIVGLIVMVVIQIVVTLYIGARTLRTLLVNTPAEAWLHEQARWIIDNPSPEQLQDFIYYAGIVVFGTITCIYTVFGGLKAVIWTDVIQAVLLMLASCVIAFFAIYSPAVGGLGNLIEMEGDRFHVFFPHDHEQLPWTGVLTGLMVLHLYYWGTNQFIVQRTLGAKTDWDGRTGLVSAGYLKMLIPFTTIVAGMAGIYVLEANPQMAMAAGLCGPDGVLNNSDDAFTALAITLLPAGYGLMGLVLTGLIGAILSTLDSLMNSSSTLFTFDIYKRYVRKDAGDTELLLVGRLGIVVAIVIGGGLAALFHSEGNFFLEASDNMGYVIGGVMVAFLFGILWAPATAAGAYFCIVSYFFLNIVIQILFNGIASLPFAKYLDPSWFDIFADPLAFGLADAPLNFMHRTALATVAASVVLVVVSRCTPWQRDAAKERLVWWNYRNSPEAIGERKWLPLWKEDRVWAIFLVILAVGLMIYFR